MEFVLSLIMEFVESVKLIIKGFYKWNHRTVDGGRNLWRPSSPAPAEAGSATAGCPGPFPVVV